MIRKFNFLYDFDKDDILLRNELFFCFIGLYTRDQSEPICSRFVIL